MSAPATPQETPGLATWLGFILMCVGMFMAILDIQVVATSLPTIQEALGITPDAMSWVQTAYLIAEIIAIPLTGLLTRVFSLRWLFVGAVSIFTAASLGCAMSGSFHMLLAFRVLQGFFGGLLIPVVFSAVFLLFPARLHAVATTIGGVVAVLAPTIGPVVGGFITNTWSWPWLFLINIVPGIIAALMTPSLLPKQRMNLIELDKLDLLALMLLAVSLASLELGLKEAPKGGWLSSNCIALLVLSGSCLTLLIQRLLASPHPILRLGSFQRRSFTLGCVSSFCLGIGLFGSVYLMPVFLAFVRQHDAFEIGKIMLVTGVAQLIAAPLVTALDGKVDARLLTSFGFALFSAGLAASAFQPASADYQEMFWPQVVRGVGIMLPVAADADRARRSAAGRGRRRQRPVQPDAQSRRRDRHRSDRHDHLRPRRAACPGIPRPADGWRHRGRQGDRIGPGAVAQPAARRVRGSRDRLCPAAGGEGVAGALRQRGMGAACRRCAARLHSHSLCPQQDREPIAAAAGPRGCAAGAPTTARSARAAVRIGVCAGGP